jgi:hypothetical protein
MSSTRKLSEKVAWDEKSRGLELLDWETKAEDFDRLCEHVIDMLLSRGHWTREKLLSVMSEQDLRGEVRLAAERFEERFFSLPFFVYMWLNTWKLPQVCKARRERGGS